MSNITKVTYEDFLESIRLYFLWKDLNKSIKSFYSRGVNIHEAITERIVCYVNDYKHSLGGGSEDAFTKDGRKVQIKATSNYNSDLTSFGPTSQFDILHFVRLDQETDKMYLYDIKIDDLYTIKVNRSETFKDQQLSGKRPRLSVIEKFIKANSEEAYAIVDLKTKKIQKI